MSERVIHEDVKMRAVETSFGTEGAFKRDFYLVGNPEVLKPGADLYVRTRKPWPAHVTVANVVSNPPDGLKLEKGMVCASFAFVPRDNTKRVAGAVRESQGARIDKLSTEVSQLVAQNAQLLEVLSRNVQDQAAATKSFHDKKSK